MAKRINVILQDETVLTVNRAAKAGERSRFIDRAVQYCAATRSTAALRDRDLGEAIARDWFPVDHETWQTANTREDRAKGLSAAKSIP
jgi:hypothetical protein